MTPHALVDLLLHKSFFAYFLGSFVGMMGFMLICIGVQFMGSGIRTFAAGY